MKFKVGIAGLGIGTEHWRHWRLLGDQYDVQMICDPDKSRREPLAQKAGIRSTASFEEMLDAGLDIIDICTPPHLHFDMARAALTSGHHVVCEKPLVNSLAEVDQLQSLTATHDRSFTPISQYRFADGVQRVRYLVDRDIIGTPYIASVETHWLRGEEYYRAPWRGRWDTERGGVLLGHALHIHDLLCYVLGDVASVFAQVSTAVNPIETEDCATVAMTMANGALVSSSATLGSQQQLSRLRFCFEHLTVESNHSPYDPGREPWQMTASNRRKDDEIGAVLAEFTPPPAGFAGQFMDLYQHLQMGQPLTVSLADARRSLELVTAMYASAENAQVEKLPIDSSHPLYEDWRPSRS